MAALLDLLLDLFAIVGGAVVGFLLALGGVWVYFTKLNWLLHPQRSGIGAVAGGASSALWFGLLPGAVVAGMLVLRRRRRAAVPRTID